MITGLSLLPGTTRLAGIRRISRKSLKVRGSRGRKKAPEMGFQ
jgi:hypothetical protein